jgi:hypothetical protein
VFAQIDSSTRFFGEKPASYELIRVAPKKDFSTNIESILNLEEINKKLEEKNQKDNTNFLKETLPDKEIIGLKYWKGEDVTHKKLESNESLGELYTKSNILRVVFRDFGAIDGDIIKLYLNEKSLRYNIDLRSGGFSYYFELKEGYNRLDFKAIGNLW